MVNCASFVISWIRPYYTMTLPWMWCKPKTDFTPETYGNSVTFQAVNMWFSRQGHYVFFIIQLLPNVIFLIRRSLGISTPFHRLFGHSFLTITRQMIKLETHKFNGILWTPCVMSWLISNSYPCIVHAWQAWRKSLHGIYSDLFCQNVANLHLILISVVFIKKAWN